MGQTILDCDGSRSIIHGAPCKNAGAALSSAGAVHECAQSRCKSHRTVHPVHEQHFLQVSQQSGEGLASIFATRGVCHEHLSVPKNWVQPIRDDVPAYHNHAEEMDTMFRKFKQMEKFILAEKQRQQELQKVEAERAVSRVPALCKGNLVMFKWPHLLTLQANLRKLV